MKYRSVITRFIFPVLLLVLVPSCEDIWINTIFPLGGNVPGGRGVVDVVFVNDTPYRAIFTFGTYDPQDQTSVPQFGQFAVDPSQDETPFNRGLDPDTVTQRGTFVVNCGRVFSLGGEELIARINQEEDPTPVNQAPVVEAALRPGIFFTSAPLDDPDANAVESFDVRLDPVLSLLGVDYACDSLLIYTFEMDPEQAGQVRVQLEVIEAIEQ
jgi:hypothetical protein